jgi:6,7-dimethyl-8-ribityllumazine synthase
VRTDDDIEHAVRDVLRWDAHQPLIRVFGTVRCGIVTLRGSVDTWTQRCDAECTVRQLAGVRAVQNRVEVSDSPVACDTMRFQIEQAIERAGTKAGNKGEEAAVGAIEMARLVAALRDGSASA